jgi:energy-coupling factor transporter ATP-binding protein EcfA2
MEKPRDRVFVALVGHSGSGKSTLMRQVAQLLPDQTRIVRTLLSRPPREAWESQVFTFTNREHILGLQTSGQLVQCTPFGRNLYALEKNAAEIATEDTVGLICLLAESVLEIRSHGYVVKAVQIVSDRDSLDRGDPARKQEELRRQQVLLDYDLVINNSFAPGGLETSVVELIDFIQNLTS